MLCKYMYRLIGEYEYHGWFQCEYEDVKNFFKYAKNQLAFFEVVFANGECYTAHPTVVYKDGHLVNTFEWKKFLYPAKETEELLKEPKEKNKKGPLVTVLINRVKCD